MHKPHPADGIVESLEAVERVIFSGGGCPCFDGWIHIKYIPVNPGRFTSIKKNLEQNTPMAYNCSVEIQWDPVKNQANIKKHGLSFEEATELFELPEHLVLEIYDFEHSTTEDRIISIRPIHRGVIVVVSVERNDGDILRLISARFATRTEQKRYETVIEEVDHE